MNIIKKNNLISFILALYLFSVPNDFLTGRYLNGIGLSTIISIVILIWAIIQIILKGRIFFSTDIKFLILILIVGLIPIIFIQVYPIMRIATFLYYIALLVAFVNLLHWNNINTNLLISFIFFGVIAMCLYLVTNGTLGYGGIRLTTVERDFNPNVASGYVLIGLGAYISIFKRGKFLLVYLFLTGALIVTLLFFQSKTAFISLMMTLIILSLIHLWRKIKTKSINLDFKKIIKTIVVIFIFILIITELLNYLEANFNINLSEVSRVNMLFSDDPDTVTTGRTSIWGPAIEDSNLLIGKGIFTFREFYGRSPHSLYVSTIVEIGIIGIFLLIGYFVSYYKKARKIYYADYVHYLQQIYIISVLVIFGFGSAIMEYKFFWLGIFLWHVSYVEVLNKLKILDGRS